MLHYFASKYNGIVKVKSFFWKKSVWAGGVEQSGPLVKAVWKRALEGVSFPKNVLILGLGCGTAAKLISKKFPAAGITGVEIDPVMIDIGKKYFALDKIPHLKIIIADARKYHPKQRFDLVLVDTHRGPTAVPVKIVGKQVIVNELGPRGNILTFRSGRRLVRRVQLQAGF